MNQNQNKKTLRHFQCRDFLWEIFEQMSAELECSIDYLINEAMRQYARARNYSPQGLGAQSMENFSGGGAPVPPRSVGGQPSQPMMQSARHPMPPRPGPPPPVPAVPAPRPRAPQPIAQSGMPQGRSGPPQPGGYGMGGGMGQPSPPMGYGGAPAAISQPSTGRLSLIFNGRKIPITKEQFIIGRGSKTSDLPIKDGNISRKHAAIINHGGVYYIKDLGSTNGIEYNGMRIDNKRVEEGDVFHICDYEIRFTYR